MQVGLSTQKTAAIVQCKPMQHTDFAPINAISVLLTIALPVVVIGAIVAYQKHRTTILQQHIQRLNRVWQLDSSKNLF